jgi:hypothetical protein
VVASFGYLARHGRAACPEDLVQHDCITPVAQNSGGLAWRFVG